MLQAIGSITAGDSPTDHSPTVGVSATLGAADAMKIAGASPPFPSGAGKHLQRARVEEWLDKMIVWCRIWSPAMADALVFRRDQPSIGIEGARVRCRVAKEHEVYVGSQLLGSIQTSEKSIINRDEQDRCMGLDIIHTLLCRFMKHSDSHTQTIRDKFNNQTPISNTSELASRLVTWRTLKRRLDDMGEGPTESAQMGSLLKVVSKLEEVRAAKNAAQVIKDAPLSVYEMLVLLDNMAEQAEQEAEKTHSNNNSNKNNNNNTKNTNPNPNPNPNPNVNPNGSPNEGPIRVMQGNRKSGRPCLQWCLTRLGGDCRLGDNCPNTHDPKMKKADDPGVIAYAKTIPCRRNPCNFGADCMFKHE